MENRRPRPDETYPADVAQAGIGGNIMTTTAELDKQALIEMNRIAQAVIDSELTNVAAAEELRKLRKNLSAARSEAK